MTVGELLRKARKELGLTQKQVADQIGVAQPTVACWEADSALPGMRRARRVAEVYQVDAAALLPADDRSAA